MEDIEGNSKKRARTDSEASDSGSPEFKLVRVDFESSLPEEKIKEDDILDILNDTNTFGDDRDLAIEGLDSVIKSFEEEILVGPAPAVESDEAILGSSERQLELGYLLEASDDELGLPPSIFSGEEKPEAVDLATTGSDAVGLSESLGFEVQVAPYDSFDFGGETDSISEFCSNNDGDFVSVGRLFEYSDPSDLSEFMWRPESLSAS